jgi:hypothetical protein
MQELCLMSNMSSSEIAAWVQAVGSILALGAAIWIVDRQHQSAIVLQRLTKQSVVVERAEVVSELMNAISKDVKDTMKLIPDRDALVDIGSGRVYFDHTTLSRIDFALAAIPLHELESPLLVRDIINQTANVRQFRENVEKAIRTYKNMNSRDHEDFFKVMVDADVACTEIASEVARSVAEQRKLMS